LLVPLKLCPQSVLEFNNCVAVSAFPVKLPTTFPLNDPVNDVAVNPPVDLTNVNFADPLSVILKSIAADSNCNSK